MNPKEFLANPPAKVKVYDVGRDCFLILTYVPEKRRYITKNLGTENNQTRHLWDIKNVMAYAVTHNRAYGLFAPVRLRSGQLIPKMPQG